MAQYRMQVNHLHPSTLPADTIVNTFYLDTDGAPITEDDPQQLAADAVNLFATNRTFPSTVSNIIVAAYNMSDPIPREPVGLASSVPTTSGGSGPREVALCLSYYADRNIPRKRGRMYIGPWTTGAMAERPATTTRQFLGTLAEGISGLGGINVQWVQYSPTNGVFSNVTDWWVDDEWDTVRSRGLEPTTRLTGTVSG